MKRKQFITILIVAFSLLCFGQTYAQDTEYTETILGAENDEESWYLGGRLGKSDWAYVEFDFKLGAENISRLWQITSSGGASQKDLVFPLPDIEEFDPSLYNIVGATLQLWVHDTDVETEFIQINRYAFNGIGLNWSIYYQEHDLNDGVPQLITIDLLNASQSLEGFEDEILSGRVQLQINSSNHPASSRNEDSFYLDHVSLTITVEPDSSLCYIDSDTDGVIDVWDICPDTPLDSWVNNQGCPMPDLLPGITDGLVSWWSFDENIGTDVFDRNENNTGSAINSTWVDGKSKSALQFDGLSSYVTIPDSLSLAITDQLTISAAIKIQQIKDGMIVDKEGAYRLWFDHYGDSIWNNMVFEIWNGSYWESFVWTTSWELNREYYITATYDGANLKMYRNLYTVPLSYEYSGGISVSSSPLLIGKYLYSSSEHTFNGIIDEVSIYDRALSYEEIETNFNKITTMGVLNSE